MSNFVFPMALPGIGLRMTREPVYEVVTQKSVGGREMRSTWWSQPHYNYRLSIDFLRSTSGLRELQQVFDFATRHFGQLDTFLLQDPEDSAVTAHGFGVGNASTLAFQLQRSMLGDSYDTLGGPWATSSVPTINKCLQSQTFGDATWTKTNTGSKTDVVSPDGTKTGAAYTSTGTATIAQTVSGLSASTPYVLSVWARCAAGTTLKISTTEATGAAQTVTSVWSRLTLAFTTAGTSTVVTIGASSSWPVSVALEFWGAQVELGTAPGPYIATVAAAVTSTPSYWPAYASGFEPIYDAAPGPLIYIGGALKALTTDYTISATGLVTFGSAPASGAVLTWTGNYYRRVRLASAGVSTERIVQSMWRAGGIELVSVLP